MSLTPPLQKGVKATVREICSNSALDAEEKTSLRRNPRRKIKNHGFGEPHGQVGEDR